MRNIQFVLICCYLLFACKSKVINQTIEKKRQGLWIEKYTIDSAKYKSIGSYSNDDPVKRWRYYLDGKIIKKEKYKGNNCITKFYHQNGRRQSKGKTFLDTSTKYAHWYYDGSWNYYDDHGKLILKREYDNGKLLSETTIK
jgi:antitoxin component YwqK of YwqJK toxin-antitoxin module